MTNFDKHKAAIPERKCASNEVQGYVKPLAVPNTNILLAIHRLGGEEARHFHHPGTRSKRVYWTIAAALAALPIIYAIFTWGIPLLARPITAAIPISWETQLGQFVQQEFTDDEDECENAELAETMESMMARLITPLHDPFLRISGDRGG